MTKDQVVVRQLREQGNVEQTLGQLNCEWLLRKDTAFPDRDGAVIRFGGLYLS
jgi:hypothetical protein